MTDALEIITSNVKSHRKGGNEIKERIERYRKRRRRIATWVEGMEGLKPRDESRMARSTKREKRIKRERERARASEQRDKEKDTHRETERE